VLRRPSGARFGCGTRSFGATGVDLGVDHDLSIVTPITPAWWRLGVKTASRIVKNVSSSGGTPAPCAYGRGHNGAMTQRRGRLRLYLGAAPGVGKTYALLEEGRRRVRRGTEVVVGAVETHGRPAVEDLLSGIERLPMRSGALDVEGVLERAPQVVLVDELAHTNPDPSRNRYRWQDVLELLDAGLEVISTVNIGQLESLGDVVEQITGVPQAEVVPDLVVRSADQIELVDMTPEALRRRMAHGNIYPADQVDAALTRYFRVGNLSALRELALLWLADRVHEGLEQYRQDHSIATTWVTRERVVVALTGDSDSEALLRRGARIAARGAGGDLHAVYVEAQRRAAAAPEQMVRLRLLTEELGGHFHTAVSADVAGAVLHLANSLNASQIVVGASRRPRWRRLFGPGVSDRVVAGGEDIDVLVVTHPVAHRRLIRHQGAPLGRWRTIGGWLLALVGPAALSALLVPATDVPTLALEAMAYLALTVLCALVGGLWPAVTAAVLGSLLLNWFFTPPQNTLTIADTVNLVALLLFLLVAVGVASVVDRSARRSIQADEARREAATLTRLNRTLLEVDHDVEAVLTLLCETFSVDSASLLRRLPDGGWSTAGAVGPEPPTSLEDASTSAEVSLSLVLALGGPALQPHERRVLASFAAHLAVVLERQELAQLAENAALLEQGNRVRSALLAAVSHDLRTPLASIKAAVSSLRSQDVQWSEQDRAELLRTIELSADRLHAIVANLLDLSRLQADAVRPNLDQIGIDDVVSTTVASLPHGERVDLRFSPDLPPVLADAGLLDRVVANLIENALRYSSPRARVLLTTSQVGDRVQLHVVDRGPGVPDAQKEQIFEAFRRLGDTRAGEGLGLGLAVSRGLTEALGGQLTAEDTPGGGLTMVVDLPVALPRTVPPEMQVLQ
jgi:two-component system, OmpR family, sensor histidine kinase KdpD